MWWLPVVPVAKTQCRTVFSENQSFTFPILCRVLPVITNPLSSSMRCSHEVLIDEFVTNNSAPTDIFSLTRRWYRNAASIDLFSVPVIVFDSPSSHRSRLMQSMTVPSEKNDGCCLRTGRELSLRPRVTWPPAVQLSDSRNTWSSTSVNLLFPVSFSVLTRPAICVLNPRSAHSNSPVMSARDEDVAHWPHVLACRFSDKS